MDFRIIKLDGYCVVDVGTSESNANSKVSSKNSSIIAFTQTKQSLHSTDNFSYSARP